MNTRTSLFSLLLIVFAAVVGESQVQTLDSSYRYGSMGQSYVNPAVPLPPVPDVPAKASPSVDIFRNLPEKMSLSQAKEAVASLARVRADQHYNALLKIAAAVEIADLPSFAAYVASPQQRQNAYALLGALLPRWGESDPKAAMAFADNIKLIERNTAIQNVLQGWVERDLSTASEWTQKLPKSDLRARCLTTVLGAMARVNPQAALAIAEKLGPVGNNYYYGSSYYSTIFGEWASSDPVAAAAAAAKLTPGRQRDEALMAVAPKWSEKDPEAAFAWAKALPDDNGKKNIFTQFSYTFSAIKPEVAATWALSLPSSQMQNDIITAIATHWANSDLGAAITWVKQLPEGPAKQQAVNAVASRWAAEDPKAAATYRSEERRVGKECRTRREP